MIEPVALKDFFIMFFSSALVIVAGGAYALLYAYWRKYPRSWLRNLMWLSYVVLLIAVVLLTMAAHFSGYWLILSVLMVVGYFFAPMGIWHLCVKSHATSEHHSE